MNPYTVPRYYRQEVIVPLAQVFLNPDEIEDLGWQDRALCAQTDPEAFFPEKGGSTREAKRTCRACEVRAECLEYALDRQERWGIWGGMSERERHRLARERKGTATQSREQAA
jgi:WhiB family redox-sensing transcriptional regulator